MNVTPERRAKLQHMADEYDRWEAANLPSAVFDPARSHEGSDYNLHYLDYESGGPVKLTRSPDTTKLLESELSKVGPKGYIHGWIYVGPPGVGHEVFHSSHGKGKVTGMYDRGDGSHTVKVNFDNGRQEIYRGKIKPTSKPRLYGPAKTDAEIPPMAEMKHPPRRADAPLQHNLRLEQGFAINTEGRTVGEIESYGGLNDRTYTYHHARTDDLEHGFATQEEALTALARRDIKHSDDEFARIMARREQEIKDRNDQLAREAEREKHVFAPRRAKATRQAISSKIPAEKRRLIQERRQRIVDLHGANLRIQNDLSDPVTALHMRQFFAIPESHHKIIAKAGYQIDVGRGPVGEYHPEIADHHPSGYEAGKTWMDSAGAQDSYGKWLVFGNTAKHGSHNMVAHEMGHALDYSLNHDKYINPSPASFESGSPWGAGFQSYFTGLNAYDAAGSDALELTRLLPYYRSEIYGGHGNGHKEMFAEAYSAYVSSAPDDRAKNISKTLKGNIDDGDHHIGSMLTEYFDDMTEWIEANK